MILVVSNTDGESGILKNLAQTSSFIDKSLLIKYILDGRRHIYIEAPPGFGKTTNLQLVQDFFTMEIDSYGYSINAGKLLKTDKIFQDVLQKYRERHENTSTERTASKNETVSESAPVNVTKPINAVGDYLKNYVTFSKPRLKILEDWPELFESHFARYPVLMVDFGVLSTDSYLDYESSFTIMVSRLFEQFNYLLLSKRLTKLTKDEFLLFRDGYKELSIGEVALGGEKLVHQLSYHHQQKAIVLVDNFDIPIRKALFAQKLDDESFTRIVENVCRFVKLLVKSEDVFRTVVTGNLRINITDGLVHLPVFEDKFLHQYYGLIEDDVFELARRFNKEKHIAEVRTWYSGYRSERKGHNIYNTRSTLSYFQTGQLKPYRNESVNFKTMKTLLNFERLGREIEDAFDNKTRLLIRQKIPLRALEQLRRSIFELKQTSSVVHRDLILQILLDHGFYTVYDGNRLSVPNLETKLDINNLIFDRAYYITKLNITNQTIDDFVQSIERITGEEASLHNFSVAVTELFKYRLPRGTRELAHTLLTLAADDSKFSIQSGWGTLESDRQDVLVRRSTEMGIVIGILTGSVTDDALKPVFDRCLQEFPECKSRVAILLGLKSRGSLGDLEVLYAFDNRTRVDTR
ncbi:uncharacterized protein [Bemisia tabaci]|uniref:uncharacterized protein isoform X2 n=1 Tax=Bemisia tabaci TaxID=7038 RepID=UPI003B288705